MSRSDGVDQGPSEGQHVEPEPRRRMLHGAIAGDDVRLVQYALLDIGFDPGRVDGIYGVRVAAAVRSFQRARSLTPNGIVDRETWNALAKESANTELRKRKFDRVLVGATSGEDLKTAQLALRAAGFDPGEIDGVYGPDTRRAVEEFQRKKGLSPDGMIGSQTWSALFEAEPAEHDSDADISGSVNDLRRTLSGKVTAYAVVAALLSHHGAYGGDMATSIKVGAPDGAQAQTVDDWVKAVRPLFVPQGPGKLDGRKVIYGLALLDPELQRQLGERGFLTALGREIPTRGQLSGRGRALRKADAVPTLSDQPSRVDLLGRRAFAEALAGRLRDEFRRTDGPAGKPDSFMVHLEGPWGSGKTSLLGFLGDELSRQPEPWLIVDFNAWQNQRAGAPWWLLISAVLRAAVKDTRNIGWSQRRRLQLRALWWRLQLAKAEITVVAMALTVVVLLALTGNLTGGDPVGILVGAVSSVVAAATGLHGLRSSVNGGSKEGANTFIQRTRDPMNTLKDRFNDLVKDLHRPTAIFIDDLDRCRASFVVDLLEGVQTILRDAPVAFVVAADRHWLYDAYAGVYGDYLKTHVDPGRPLGHLFLEKTFQLSTSVPRISPEDQRTFWKRLLSPPEEEQVDQQALAREAGKDFASLKTEAAILGALDRQPGRTPEENRARREAAVRQLASPTLQRHIEHTLTPLAPLLEPNPRAMKRLVNAYGIERAVQILEGHSGELEHPRELLALWTILKSRWPLLSDYLSDHPEALEDLQQNRIPAKVAGDEPQSYLRALFQDRAAGRIARGEGLDGISLDPASLRLLVAGPGTKPVFNP